MRCLCALLVLLPSLALADYKSDYREGLSAVERQDWARVDALMRKAMAEKPDEFDPRAFLKAATAAARDICKARFEAFGCAGQGSRIGVRPLAKAA